MKKGTDIYEGRDPRDLPFYSVADAARVVRMSPATVRSWAYGRRYRTAGGERRWHPLIEAADEHSLSFRNLVELHVLSSLRGVGKVDPSRIAVAKIRRAASALKERVRTDHPLADVDLRTDWKDIYVEILGGLINVSDPQQRLRSVIEPLLEQIDRDEKGLAQRLFPGTSKLVVIDPKRRFGRPVLAHANIETATIAERFAAGDDPAAIARDLDLDEADVNAAVRFEYQLRDKLAA